jgi:hypothetical protein
MDVNGSLGKKQQRTAAYRYAPLTAGSPRGSSTTGVIASTGAIEIHVDDIKKDAFVDVPTVDELVVDNFDEETAGKLLATLPQIRKRLGDAFLASLLAVIRFCPEFLPQFAAHVLRGAVFVEIPIVLPGLPKVAIVDGVSDVEQFRAQRLRETKDPLGGGRLDQWQVAHFVDLKLWRLIEETLDSGIVWLTENRSLGFRVATSVYRPYYGSNSIVPATVAFVDLLETKSAEFRRARTENVVREIARPS